MSAITEQVGLRFRGKKQTTSTKDLKAHKVQDTNPVLFSHGATQQKTKAEQEKAKVETEKTSQAQSSWSEALKSPSLALEKIYNEFNHGLSAVEQQFFGNLKSTFAKQPVINSLLMNMGLSSTALFMISLLGQLAPAAAQSNTCPANASPSLPTASESFDGFKMVAGLAENAVDACKELKACNSTLLSHCEQFYALSGDKEIIEGFTNVRGYPCSNPGSTQQLWEAGPNIQKIMSALSKIINTPEILSNFGKDTCLNTLSTIKVELGEVCNKFNKCQPKGWHWVTAESTATIKGLPIEAYYKLLSNFRLASFKRNDNGMTFEFEGSFTDNSKLPSFMGKIASYAAKNPNLVVCALALMSIPVYALMTGKTYPQNKDANKSSNNPDEPKGTKLESIVVVNSQSHAEGNSTPLGLASWKL